jgi:PAS domain S-box-containing protein
MMKNTLFRMDGSDEFVLRICERCMEDGLPGNAKAGREDLERICTPFVNMLGKLSQGNSGARISGINDLGPYGAALVEESIRYRDMGMSLETFLGLFKALTQSLEDLIAASGPGGEALGSYRTLRHIADTVETAIAGRWERSMRLGMLKGHESATDRETHDRNTGRPDHAQTNAEKMHRAIFNSVGEGILLVDQDLEIIQANQQAAEIYGIPLQNLVGSDIRNLTDEHGLDVLMGFFHELVEGQRFSAEITGIYINGRTFPASVTVTRTDYDGKKFWTIIVHDITEQKALEQRLCEEKDRTEEMNITLRNVLNTIEKDRKDFEGRLSARIKTSILPALEKVEKEPDASVRKSYLALIGQQLADLTSGSSAELDAGLLKLSKTELGICRLIQAGCSSKEICEAMNLSFETIQTHRKNIRRKLRLRGKKVNLHAFLSNRVIDSTGSTSQEGEFMHE